MRVYMGNAVGRAVEPMHMKAMAPLLRDPKYAYFPQIGDALMERVRGMSATYFLRHTDADIHLSLDSDIIDFKKEAIDLMCEQAEEFGIVGAVYICRSTARTFPASYFKEDQCIEFAHDTTPVPIRWIATGCVAVARRVFQAMVDTGMPLLHEEEDKRAFYDFYETMHYDLGKGNGGLIKLSEDYSFSERAMKLGFQSYINPAIRVGHVGPYVHRIEDMAQTILAPQPLSLTHVGKFWHIACEGIEETPEAMGRLKGDKPPREIQERFEKLKKETADVD